MIHRLMASLRLRSIYLLINLLITLLIDNTINLLISLLIDSTINLLVVLLIN